MIGISSQIGTFSLTETIRETVHAVVNLWPVFLRKRGVIGVEMECQLNFEESKKPNS